MNVLTKDFRELLSVMQKLSGSTESETVRLETIGGKLSVVGVAVTGRLRKHIDCNGDLGAVVYVDKDVLNKTLATRVQDAEIEIVVQKNKLLLQQGQFNASVACSKGTYGFDLTEEVSYGQAWQTNPDWLSHAIDICSVPVEKDYSKTRGLLLDLRDDRICILGTDSTGASHTHIFEAASVGPLPGIVFVLSKQSAQMLALLSLGELQFEKNGRRMLAHANGTAYRASAIRNTYPDDYRSVFNLNQFWSWSTLDFDRSDLLNALASAQSVMSDADQAYKFSVNGKYQGRLVVGISGRNDRIKHEASDKVLADGDMSNVLEFALRRGKIESSLKAITSEKVRFYVKSPDVSIVLTEIPDNGFRAIHLPLRV